MGCKTEMKEYRIRKLSDRKESLAAGVYVR